MKIEKHARIKQNIHKTERANLDRHRLALAERSRRDRPRPPILDRLPRGGHLHSGRTAFERRGNTLKRFEDFYLNSQGQNLALTFHFLAGPKNATMIVLSNLLEDMPHIRLFRRLFSRRDRPRPQGYLAHQK